ncbi:MAG: MotA/TolQ/ExbB proton channel family protein [Kiritimatiellae bacterium]|nr:MotA/TolQ/ExbB proton channel family protein [Kiritimatiellia bacterium]
MKRRGQTVPIILLIVGAVLCLGPVWGLLGTVLGMTRAFNTLSESTAGSREALAGDIGVALWTSAIGWVALPFGLALVVGSIVWLVRIDNPRRRGAGDVGV